MGFRNPHHQLSTSLNYFIVKKPRFFSGLSLIFCVYNDFIAALRLLCVDTILLFERVTFDSYLTQFYFVSFQTIFEY